MGNWRDSLRLMDLKTLDKKVNKRIISVRSKFMDLVPLTDH